MEESESLDNPPVAEASFEIRNCGPWTIVEYSPWSQCRILHTTALGANAGVQFQHGKLTDDFRFLLHEGPYFLARQVHGTNVKSVRNRSECYLGTDGFVSEKAGRSLVVRTADCLPVYVKSSTPGSLPYALFHAGWRGLLEGIVPRGIEEWFQEEVEVFVGPHIPVHDYEVGRDVIRAMQSSLKMSRERLLEAGLLTTDSHMDLFEVLRYQLGQVSTPVDQIYRSPMVTTQSDPVPLLSYRTSETDERMLNWFLLRNHEVHEVRSPD